MLEEANQIQNFFGQGVREQISKLQYLAQKYPGLSVEEAERWEADRRRRLTPAEIALARSIYASSIRFDKVTVYNKNWKGIPFGAPHAPNGHIYFPPGNKIDETAYREDFGRAATYGEKSVFIHELCHVWQHQRGVSLPMHILFELRPNFRRTGTGVRLENGRNYIYSHMFRTPGWRRHFSSLDWEAQAEFMSDYYLVKKGQPAKKVENQGFSRADYESRLPPAMRAAGVGAPTS